jgi:flagella basal body P-ring formation protein FlgA
MIYLRVRGTVFPLFDLARPTSVLLILFWLFCSDPAHAQPAYQSIASIRAAALDHARAASPPNAALDGGRIDERLRLAACSGPLSTRTASTSASALSVEVRCDALGWKLFLPVGVNVQVPVLVATRGLARGDAVSAADVQLQMRPRAGLGVSWVGSVDQIQGRTLLRPVTAGSVLSPASFAASHLVRRGQSVTLIGISGGFEVRAQGKALADAGAGDRVRVQNTGSQRIVEGEVRADGSVVVPL